jgi:Flp pilus assembly protein TadD
VYLRRGDLDAAQQTYTKAIDLDSNDAQPAIGLGSVSFSRGHLDEAEKWYKKAIALDPRDANPVYCLGTVYYKRGDWANAEKYYRQAVSLDEKQGQYHAALAGALTQLGRTSEAIASAQRARDLGFNEQWALDLYKSLGM